MSQYEAVQKGCLKLKTDSGIGKKKKNKKRKKLEQSIQEKAVEETEAAPHHLPVDMRTKAQKAFDQRLEKKSAERALSKASKTHKQRVEEFNRHLDTLTEHFDIPKVSWTK